MNSKMKKVKVRNVSKNCIIIENAEIADTFIARLCGLVGKENLEENTGLIIIPCNSIHMYGMKFEIDAIFVDKDNIICHIIHAMKKMKISPIVRQAKYVIEVPSGTAKQLNIELNDRIELIKLFEE